MENASSLWNGREVIEGFGYLRSRKADKNLEGTSMKNFPEMLCGFLARCGRRTNGKSASFNQ